MQSTVSPFCYCLQTFFLAPQPVGFFFASSMAFSTWNMWIIYAKKVLYYCNNLYSEKLTILFSSHYISLFPFLYLHSNEEKSHIPNTERQLTVKVHEAEFQTFAACISYHFHSLWGSYEIQMKLCNSVIPSHSLWVTVNCVWAWHNILTMYCIRQMKSRP